MHSFFSSALVKMVSFSSLTFAGLFVYTPPRARAPCSWDVVCRSEIRYCCHTRDSIG